MGVYPVVFLLAAVPFGLFMGLFVSWSGGVIGAVVFGGVFVAIIRAMSRAARRTVPGVSAPAQVGHLALERSPEDVLVTALEAVRSLQVTRVTEDDGVVTGHTRVSWRSWGEVVTVQVRAAGGGSDVRVGSRPRLRTTLVDYGTARRNVETVVRALGPDLRP